MVTFGICGLLTERKIAMKIKKLFSGEYEVTSEGEIFSRKKGGCRLLKGALYHSKNGDACYRTVLLTVQGQQKNYYVHRLVAEAFVENPDHLPCVRHKDGDSLNNRAENLEWCTRSTAIQCAVDDGRISVWKNAVPCARCQKPMISKKSNLCVGCQAAEKKEQRANSRAERLCQELSNIPQEILSPLQSRAVALRRDGRTFQSIADEMNISCQYAHQLVKLAMAKAGGFQGRGKQTPQYVARFQQTQERKLERKRDKLKKAIEEANKLSSELRAYSAPIQ